METFRFRLDRILLWYRSLADLEEARFAECHAHLCRGQEAMARLRAERQAIEHCVIRSATISPQDLAALDSYRMHTLRRESELTVEVRNREKAMEEQLAKLIAMQRRVKLLEKVRERRAEEHRYLTDRELEAVAADAYTAKWIQESTRQ